ncbi:hypothetical protein BD779DRAFT_1666859 [Infundibulicybe gibba]|nr:hypothetical protein BD779DRAFT_1666859 [Infundibulicybe gibba]
MSSDLNILLKPRPYARASGELLLLPLLPQREPFKPLPSEIWTEIFKALRLDIALPVVYSKIYISKITALEKFHLLLCSAEQKWDSIRRIPYSTPGRWVQVLDLSDLAFTGHSQALLLDSLLTSLFPLIPFLARFAVNPSFILSRRVINSLADREGAVNIRALHGLTYFASPTTTITDDPLVGLLQCCSKLEVLEIIGQGFDSVELDLSNSLDVETPTSCIPLNLPSLQTLSMLSMHSSPLMLCLLSSKLPSLRKLTITPYDDIPYPTSLATQFISAHGSTLRSLLLLTPKSWPTRLHPSPQNLLELSPNLRHLSLESPIPSLTLVGSHNLQILSIPRPNSDLWRALEHLFPRLPSLCVLRIRDVRWLRKGMNSRAQEAGVQGEMREWRRRLSRQGIRLLDADWRDND